MAASDSSFLTVLQGHQLLSPDQLGDVARLDADSQIRVMVERGWLTAYQAEQLAQGNGEGLFLGSYLLIEPLGEGGMGQVFKALHRRINRLVALKIIRESLAADPEVIRRFQREARAAARLSHPNIVTLYDADQVENTHFIALEYVVGPDLAHWVREHGPPTAGGCPRSGPPGGARPAARSRTGDGAP